MSKLPLNPVSILALTRARLNGLRCGARHAIALYSNDTPVFDTLLPLARGVRDF